MSENIVQIEAKPVVGKCEKCGAALNDFCALVTIPGGAIQRQCKKCAGHWQGDAGIETLPSGGKQSKEDQRCQFLPPLALLATAKILTEGAAKYGVKNWHNIPVDENVGRAVRHLLRWLETEDIEELKHASCRVLFALDLQLRKET